MTTIFNSEAEFEQALVAALQNKGWEQTVLRYPTEADLLQNWANILFENNRGIDRLNEAAALGPSAHPVRGCKLSSAKQSVTNPKKRRTDLWGRRGAAKLSIRAISMRGWIVAPIVCAILRCDIPLNPRIRSTKRAS